MTKTECRKSFLTFSETKAAPECEDVLEVVEATEGRFYLAEDWIGRAIWNTHGAVLTCEWTSPEKDAVPVPVPGMGVTYGCGSDCYPFTVLEVINERTLVIQEDVAVADKTKTGGMGHQNWIVTRNCNGPTTTITLRNNGKWYQKGEPKGSCDYFVGRRCYHYCWEF